MPRLQRGRVFRRRPGSSRHTLMKKRGPRVAEQKRLQHMDTVVDDLVALRTDAVALLMSHAAFMVTLCKL